MAYAVTTDGSGFVRGSWSGGATIPSGTTEITEQEFASLGHLRHEGSGPARWKIENGSLVANPDDRPIVRFTPTSVTLDVGGLPGSVTMEVVDDQGNVRTNIGTALNPFVRRIPIAGYRVKLSVVQGVASISVPTGRARSIRVGSNEFFRVLAPLDIEVCDDGAI